MANVAVRDTTVPTGYRGAVTLIRHIDVAFHLGGSGRRGDGRSVWMAATTDQRPHRLRRLSADRQRGGGRPPRRPSGLALLHSGFNE
jgi:hypothetical protein